MEAEEGKRVIISFICKLEDGTIYDFSSRDRLEFVIGQGNTLPTLEMGVLGMKPGDTRTIRVPAAEVEDFQFNVDEAPTDEGFPAGTAGGGYGYEFGPGEGGDDDVYLTIPEAPMRSVRDRPPAGSDLIFEVDLISVEDAELDLGDV